MNNKTLLFRQVSPAFVKSGRVTSQVFIPTRKDNKKLSVYNSDQFSAEESWGHFTANKNCNSKGVLAVTIGECNSQKLKIIIDDKTFEGHVLIDFSNLTNSETIVAGRYLVNIAIERGWQFEI